MKMLGLFLTFAVALMLVASVLAGASSVTLQETDLTSFGEAYEVNRGSDGFLYLSDYSARQIWRVDPVNLEVKNFQFNLKVLDAQPDNSGYVWFTDGGPTFARLDPITDQAVYWEVPLTPNLQGLTFDPSGKLWMTEWINFNSKIYSFDIPSSELCIYSLPREGGLSGSSQSFYILSDQGKLWIANRGEQKIYRLDPAQNQATWWKIPFPSSRPVGIALDGNGNLWWADEGLGALARLDPGKNEMTRYNLSNTAKPKLIVLINGAVWYTAANPGSTGNLGVLYPQQANGTGSTLVSQTYPVNKDCSTNLGAGKTLSVSVTTSEPTWTTAGITTLFDNSSWQVYQLPDLSNPYGITFDHDQIWVIDQARKKLMRVQFTEENTMTPSPNTTTLTATPVPDGTQPTVTPTSQNTPGIATATIQPDSPADKATRTSVAGKTLVAGMTVTSGASPVGTSTSRVARETGQNFNWLWATAPVVLVFIGLAAWFFFRRKHA